MEMKKHRFCNMIGCINGIICLGGYFVDGFLGFGLWNPAIRKRKTVHYPLLPDCPAHLLPSSKYFKTYHAFGYDQYSNDYKVIRSVTYHKLDTSTRTLFFTDYYYIFHVYSLNVDSWYQISGTTIHHSNIRLCSRFNGFYFNGVHYWRGFLDYGYTNELGKDCDCEIVLAFDMSRDTFQVMKLPEEVFRVMVRVQRPLPFAKNGELLLLGDHYTHTALLLYNIGSQEIKTLQPTSFPTKAMVYVESLVSFTGRNVF